MIITQAPLRVSFFGGGSDFPEYFQQHGGAVLATAIDRYAYVTIQPFADAFFDHRLRVSYSENEAVMTADDVRHPAIRASLRYLGFDTGIELHHMADLPARTGLGSSSSFVVALLQALHAYKGSYRAPETLAGEAIEIERVILQEAGGHQDQIIAAVGGTCLIRFCTDGRFTVSPIPLSARQVADWGACFLLAYTGIRRNSYTVQQEHKARLERNCDALREMAQMAVEAASLLSTNASLRQFGELLHEGWALKRSLCDVSLTEIDDAYEAGRRAGAWGGKLLGAGRGGFLLFMAEPDRHQAIQDALPGMRTLRFGLNAPGSRVVFAQATQ